MPAEAMPTGPMRENRWLSPWGRLFIFFLLLFSLAAGADDGNDEHRGPKDMFLAASMDELIARIQSKYEGSILKVELKSPENAPGWRYKVKMLPSTGNVLKLEYDAETLDLLRVKGDKH